LTAQEGSAPNGFRPGNLHGVGERARVIVEFKAEGATLGDGDVAALAFGD